MKLVKVPLVAASDDQLRWYGENVKGLEMTGHKTRAKVMGALGPVIGEEDHILVPEESAPEVAQDMRPVVQVDAQNDYSSVLDAPTVTVKIMANGNAVGGKDDVFVSVNTKGLRLARNLPVRLPYPYFEALTNAVCATVTQDDDGTMVETETNNYPFHVLEPVDPAALAAFRAATDSKPLYA